MDKKLFDIYSESYGFELENRFSEPLWEFFYNFHSLRKYWILTKDFIETFKNDEFFDDSEENWDLLDEAPEPLHELPNLDGGGDPEHDLIFVPTLQRSSVICISLALTESMLKKICEESDPKFRLDGKGSYFQQYTQFLNRKIESKVPKDMMRAFEAFGHVRNSFMHQIDLSIPKTSMEYLNNLTGPFSDIKGGVTNIHVEICLETINKFGEIIQASYWKHFDSENNDSQG